MTHLFPSIFWNSYSKALFFFFLVTKWHYPAALRPCFSSFFVFFVAYGHMMIFLCNNLPFRNVLWFYFFEIFSHVISVPFRASKWCSNKMGFPATFFSQPLISIFPSTVTLKVFSSWHEGHGSLKDFIVCNLHLAVGRILF